MFNVTDEIKGLFDETVKNRRHLHQYPELGFQEHNTSDFIYNKLVELGYKVSKVAGTGVVALLKDSNEYKTLAIRADIDCLPLQELNNVEYTSKNEGKMHACGHDGHTAIALSLAKLVMLNKENFSGNVKFIFQPAEEGPGGAKPMIEEGVLENPKVDAIIGLHVWNSNEIGEVVIKDGPLMASADEFSITVIGKGGHGAIPQQTIDAIVVMAHIITALQTVVSRNINPLDSAVLTIGKIEGGSNFNIIAESSKIIGTVRTFSNELREVIKDRIEQIVKNITSAFGATYAFEYKKLYAPTINNKEISDLVKKSANGVIDKINDKDMTMGAEDMSYFLERVPGCYFFVGSANKSKGLDKPHHSPYFDFDENAMLIGIQILYNSILEYFNNNRG
jgi:amidohydrolase